LLSFAEVKNWGKHSLTNAMLAELSSQCPKLQHLHLSEVNLNDVSSKNLPNSLQELSLTSCLMQQAWWDEVMQSKGLPQLLLLDLTQSSKTCDSDVRQLCRLTSLQILKLNGCYRLHHRWISELDGDPPALLQLEIAETQCTDLTLHQIVRHFPLLTKFNVNKCNRLTRGGISTAADCLPNLRWFDVGGLDFVDDACLQSLKSLKHLEYLNLKGTRVTKAAGEELSSKLPSLKTIIYE
jgi:hypothetical protein